MNSPKQSLTAPIFEELKSAMGWSDEQARQALPIWNKAMRVVDSESRRKAKIEVLTALTSEISLNGGEPITTLGPDAARKIINGIQNKT